MGTNVNQLVIGDGNGSSIAFAAVFQSLLNFEIRSLDELDRDTSFFWVSLGPFDSDMWKTIRSEYNHAYLITLPLQKIYPCLHLRTDILELAPTNLIGSCFQKLNQRPARNLRSFRFIVNVLAIRWHGLPYRIMDLMGGSITEEVIEQIERLEECARFFADGVQSSASLKQTRGLNDFLNQLFNAASINAISEISSVYRNVGSTSQEERKRKLIDPHKEIVNLAESFHNLLAE